MIGKEFTYKGQNISRTTADFQVGITMVQWRTLDVTDEQQNVQGYHGIRLSPTFARGRRITLEGIIIADDHVGSSKGIDYLEELFALQGVPASLLALPFTVSDEQDRVWEINAKIKEPLSVELSDDDFIQGTTRRWRVVLQSEDPRYFGAVEKTVEGSEGVYGGFELETELEVAMDDVYNQIVVLAQGNIETPLIIRLDVLNDIDTPLSIKNLTDGTYFDLDISAVDGDIIIVDSVANTATKNGSNILANRIVGSTWLKAKGETIFSIYDADGGLANSDFDVLITYKDVLL